MRHIGIRYANFVTDKGQGLDLEIVRGFARHIGVSYELVYSDFYHVGRDPLGQDVVSEGGKALLIGSYTVKYDMIATGFTILPWREGVLLCSKAAFPSQVPLVKRTDSPLRPFARQTSLAREIEATRELIGRKSLLVMERTGRDPANDGLKGEGIDLRAHTDSTDLHDMVPAMLRSEGELALLDVPDAVLDSRAGPAASRCWGRSWSVRNCPRPFRNSSRPWGMPPMPIFGASVPPPNTTSS